MALGPFPQILLGCTNAGPNSVVINANSGAITAKLAGEAGADQVWFNPGDNTYFLGSGNHLSPSGNADPILGTQIVDHGCFRRPQHLDLLTFHRRGFIEDKNNE